ncbi:MAG: SIS domain-containing protein [Nocardioidaceae bacterium]|nr:SIS domain-containing protein [Nocardioidaceae bacterium]
MTAQTPTGQSHVDELVAAASLFGPAIETAEQWGCLLAQRLGAGARLLAAGNGGSAAQAQHLTAELVGRYRDERRPLSAICLSAETSSLTAIINDYPADELFARQVQAHGREGDLLVLMSTSGRSPNILSAADRGRQCGLTVLAFTGPRPNPLAAVADEALCVPSQFTATVQELHLVAMHLVCASLDLELSNRAADHASGVADSSLRVQQWRERGIASASRAVDGPSRSLEVKRRGHIPSAAAAGRGREGPTSARSST